jgi:hypothetical protein
MNKLIKLANIIGGMGLQGESQSIIRLARVLDLVYQKVAGELISDLEEQIRSEQLIIRDFPNALFVAYTSIKVDLSDISDYKIDHISIILRVYDPKLNKKLDTELDLRRKKNHNFKTKESFPLAIGFGLKPENGELVGTIDLYPNYSLFKKLSSMTKIEAAKELFFGGPYFGEGTLRSIVAHELAHILDSLRYGERTVTVDPDYSNSTSEINARIQEILYRLFSEELKINIETGEGWIEIGKRWAEADSWDKHFDFSLQVYEWVNDGDPKQFINGIMEKWGKSLYINSKISEDTKKRYINRLYDIWNKLREFHAKSAPSLPPTPRELKMMSDTIQKGYNLQFKDPISFAIKP